MTFNPGYIEESPGGEEGFKNLSAHTQSQTNSETLEMEVKAFQYVYTAEYHWLFGRVVLKS